MLTVAEAVEALKVDRLGTVYFRADGVFVTTAKGSGTFGYLEWKAANGAQNSQRAKE